MSLAPHPQELAEVVRRNPLAKVAVDPKRYQVSFCSAEPEAGDHRTAQRARGAA